MTQPWQKPLVASLTAECRRYLDEAAASGDTDLMEEMSAKMLDVLLVWRRSQPRELISASDEELRQMAFAHAVAEVFPELQDSDEMAAAFVVGGGET